MGCEWCTLLLMPVGGELPLYYYLPALPTTRQLGLAQRQNEAGRLGKLV